MNPFVNPAAAFSPRRDRGFFGCGEAGSVGSPGVFWLGNQLFVDSLHVSADIFRMGRISIVAAVIIPFWPSFAGDYLVVFRQHVSTNVTPAAVECDSLEIWPGYSKLLTKGKPVREVKGGALVAVVEKKDYEKLGKIAEAFPALRPALSEIETRWKTEVDEEKQKQREVEKAFEESFSRAAEIRTLGGESFRGVIKAANTYSLTVSTAEGVTSVEVADLCSEDLKKWDTVERGRDGRFWYERSLAVIRARESGIDVTTESKEVETHSAKARAYLAEMDRVKAERKRALSATMAAAKNNETGTGGKPVVQENSNEVSRMSTTGDPLIQDDFKWLYSSPEDREKLLRKVMEANSLTGQ